MQTSQNGYSAGDPNVIVTTTVPGTSAKLPVRKGPAGQLLIAAAARWHAEVEPLIPGTCWGYAYRTVRGSSTTLSNHASGTAIDLNAPKHPLGTAPSSNYTPAQIEAAHRIVAAFAPCLRWGGDYGDPSHGGVTGSRPDGMHLEVVASEAACASVLAPVPSPTPRPAPSAAALEDDLMASITITPDTAGKFHHAVGAEAGGGSAVASTGYVTFGSTYGGTTWTVAALGASGKVLGYWPSVRTTNNTSVGYQLPDGTRAVTVEGTADNSGTRPWATAWCLR